MLGDQPLGDRRPRIVELRRAVRRFAEQHDPLIGEALGEIGKLAEIAERLAASAMRWLSVVRIALARCEGISRPEA